VSDPHVISFNAVVTIRSLSHEPIFLAKTLRLCLQHKPLEYNP
jgi:hypothetical protein